MKSFCCHLVVLLLSILCGVIAVAQTPDVVIDKSTIKIGEQAIIRLSVPFEKDRIPKVKWPAIGDTIVGNVEVISKTEIDTLKTGQEVPDARLEQRITITSFDSGYYAIPPFKFQINDSITQTDAFLFTVQTVEVDTTGGMMDIVEIEEVSLNWRDYLMAYWPYAAGFAGGLILLGTVIYFVRQTQRKRKARGPVKLPEAEKPIHVIAIERIEQLRRDRYYTVGKVKLHHTIITDTLRDYIEVVYKIPAHELTTAQMLNSLRYSGIETIWLNTLRSILATSDLVKFAKEKPDEVENETAITRAIDFVRATWEVIALAQAEVAPAENESRAEKKA